MNLEQIATRDFLLYFVNILSVHIIYKINQNLLTGNLLIDILIVRPSEIFEESILDKLPSYNHKLTLICSDYELSDVIKST